MKAGQRLEPFSEPLRSSSSRLLRTLQGLRSIVIDRPGFGLSTPVDYAKEGFPTVVDRLLNGVLDALDIDRAAVVGASIGNAWALHPAARQPARVECLALMGGGPLTPEIQVPGFVRMLRTPVGAVVVRIPEEEKMLNGILRGLGHGPSLDAGRIPREYLDWHMSLSRNTPTMHYERQMVRAIVGRSGFRPGLMLDESQLAAIRQPTLMVYGTSDDVGSVDIWRHFVGRLPEGQLQVVEHGGHLPWLDDPDTVGARLAGFLGQSGNDRHR